MEGGVDLPEFISRLDGGARGEEARARGEVGRGEVRSLVGLGTKLSITVTLNPPPKLIKLRQFAQIGKVRLLNESVGNKFKILMTSKVIR